MKKIVFFVKGMGIGGVERVLLSYLKGLSKVKEYKITLIVDRNITEQNVLLKDIPENIEVIFAQSEKLGKLMEESSEKRKKNPLYRIMYQGLLNYNKRNRKKFLMNYFNKNDADVLIDFEMSTKKYAEKINCKKMGWIHVTISGITDSEKIKQEYEYMNKYDRIVSICDEMKDEIIGRYPTFVEKAIKLYNPQQLSYIKEKSEDTSQLTEAEKNLLEKEFIVTVSRLNKTKGIADLIRVYEKLKKRGIKEKLYIIGSGKEKENLENLIEKFNLTDEVFLLGAKQNPYPWMKKAKLFVTTSYGEGLPTTLIEAMTCGTPVVSYDCPTGPKEILGYGKNGALVKMGDIQGFADKLHEVLADALKIKEYKKTLDEKTNEFSVEIVIPEFQKAIEEIGVGNEK